MNNKIKRYICIDDDCCGDLVKGQTYLVKRVENIGKFPGVCFELEGIDGLYCESYFEGEEALTAQWLKMSNDDFFKIYGFSWTPSNLLRNIVQEKLFQGCKLRKGVIKSGIY